MVQPSHKPTDASRKQVEALASYGIPQPEIAGVLGITDRTLRKYYRKELDTAETKANAMVAQNLFRQATRDDPKAIPAAIFWMKTRAKWSEKIEHEHSGEVQFLISKTDAAL